MIADKRTETDALDDVQKSNQKWWTDSTMSYDWKEAIAHAKYSREWYDEIDKRFIHGARLFAHGDAPFDRIIPFDTLAGKRVLEIGCGMGLHSELLARAGADLTSIDLSPTSVAATQKRFELKGLKGDIRRMDAEHLEFPDQTFDFVWSWGVLHHSSRTGRCIREVHRVLKPSGQTRIMVYYLGGMTSYITMMLHYSHAFWRGRSLDELLWKASDGFTARYYSKDALRDIFNIFFDEVDISTFGQDADAIPLPRHLRRIAARFVSEKKQIEWGNKRGFFIFAVGSKPV